VKDEQRSTHPRRLEAHSFASLANSQLHRVPDNTPLGCTFRLALAHEEPSLGPEAIAAFVAGKAALVPLATDCGDDYVVQDVRLAAQAAGSSASGVALETPCEAIFLDEGCLRVEGLLEMLARDYGGEESEHTSPHSAQKKWPTCHSAPHATTTSPSMGVLQLLQRGLNISWKSRWQ
jgi:hypothetical protein